MKQKLTAIYAVMLFFSAVYSYAGQRDGKTNGFLDWIKMDISTEVRLNLRSLGITIPAGRNMAENQLFSEYFSQIRPFIYSIPVDSSSVLGDLVKQGELSPETVDKLVFNAKAVPPSISTDIQDITASYTISLNAVCSVLVDHSGGANFMHVIDPEPVASYTGIIIIAKEALPVHGKNTSAYLAPCLFPKIWDTEMNLVFDKTMTEPHIFHESMMISYMGSDHIFKRTPSGLSPEIEKIVGNRPLRIIAHAVFGISPTDPIIDSDDARVILSSDINKNLLREGRVVIITSDTVLKTNLK
ncbi:MAG: polymerase [Spirochaetaceae bacterium]|jgi:hypothetical protein|nr:polymerase [Spirochaetaceae bacterium]